MTRSMTSGSPSVHSELVGCQGIMARTPDHGRQLVYPIDQLVHTTYSIAPIEGPLTERQAQYVDWMVQNYFNNIAYEAAGESNRFQCRPDFTYVEDIGLDHPAFSQLCDFRRDAEQRMRKMFWVTATRGREHFCPGYYNCLACYPD